MPRVRDLQQYTGALNRPDIYFVVDGASFGRGQKLSGQQVYTMCKGVDGKNIEIRASGGFLQWKQEGTPGWTNLVALNDLKGADGKNVELRKHEGYIQSRPTGGSWTNLVALADLKGDKGDPAETPNLSFTAVSVPNGGQPTAQVSGVYPNLQIKLGLPAGKDADAPNLTFRTKELNPGEQPTAEVSGIYPNLQVELGLPAGRDASVPAFTTSAETLSAGQQPEVAVSGNYPNLQLAFKIPAGDRGPEGKPLTVLANGHYGQWDEAQGKYVDSGIEAAATVDINNVHVTFTESAAHAQIETGESIPTLFGKIRKWFSELKTLAFKDKVDYNTDVENTPQLGALAGKSRVDYNTEVDNLPSLITLENVRSEVSTHNSSDDAHPSLHSQDKVSSITAEAWQEQGSVFVAEIQDADIKENSKISVMPADVSDYDVFASCSLFAGTSSAGKFVIKSKKKPGGVTNIHYTISI